MDAQRPANQEKLSWRNRAQSFLLLGIAMVFATVSMPSFSHAQTPPTTRVKAPAKQKKIWLRVHVLGAEVWPRTAKDECWDPCGWGQPKLPERQLYPYSWYWKKPGFRAAATGWKAPDLRLLLKIGAYTFSTPVIKDTTRPKWNFSQIISISPTDAWRFKLLDDDSVGDQVVGQFSQKKLPAAFLKGGLLTMRKIGQIELLTLRIERLKGPPSPATKVTPASAKPLVKQGQPAMPRTSPRRPTPVKPRALPKRRAPTLRPAPRVVVLPVPRAAQRPKPQVTPRPQPRAIVPPKPLVRATPRTRVTPPAHRVVARPSPAKRVAPKARTAPVPSGPTTLVRIDIKGAWLWPTKPKGQCWDFCWSASRGLPPRGMPFFHNYFQQPAFKTIATGRRAPDPWLQVRVGKRVWTTTVQSDNVTPKWKLSLLARIGANTPISFELFDRDTFSSELIGRWKRKGLPARWRQGGLVRLGKFGQVEDVAIQVTTLEQRPKVRQVLKTASSVPAGVRFVRVTVVKARLWPITAKKKCWDTCTSWSNPRMPPRGLTDFSHYLKHPGFKSVATGRPAPDPRVKVKLGRYDVYITPTKSNTVQPVWNASHVFRIRGNEAMTVTVSDDDQNVAHDLLRTYRSTRELMDRWAEDQIGRYHTKRLPIQMIKGGRLILRSFGQVEYLELKIEPLPVPTVRKGCEGVYRVRVAEIGIQKTRADGSGWHVGVGRLSRPSPYARLWLGAQKIETPVAYKRLTAIYQTSRIIPIRKHTTMSIEVLDYNVGFSLSFDRRIKVPFVPLRIGIGMKNEPASQAIGQTAFFSACPLIKKAKHGVVLLQPFGRVKQVILFFDKIS